MGFVSKRDLDDIEYGLLQTPLEIRRCNIIKITVILVLLIYYYNYIR